MVHRRTGLLYVYEYYPGTDRPAWVRFDTSIRGQLLKYPMPVADLRDLAPVPQRQVDIVRGAMRHFVPSGPMAYRRSASRRW